MHRRTAFQGQFTGEVRSAAIHALKARRPAGSPAPKPTHQRFRMRRLSAAKPRSVRRYAQEFLSDLLSVDDSTQAVIVVQSPAHRKKGQAHPQRKHPGLAAFR